MKMPFPEPDYLIELAKHNPDELERLRVRQVNQLIEEAPEHLKPRLRGLQFQIDCKRRLHKSPLGSCIEISRMMMDSLLSLGEALQGKDVNESDRKAVCATVLQLPRSRTVSNAQ